MRKKADILLGLTKYKLSLTVSFSALTGYLITGKSSALHVLLLFSGVFLLASGGSSLNQVQEHRFDFLMERTKNRPIPSGRISPMQALQISGLLIFFGLLLLLAMGYTPALLGFLNILLYNFVYTPLKRYTAFSIIPGAMVGSVCPLIGWSAGNLSVFHPVALFLSLFVFLWQIPHFWLLLLHHSQDYQKAGFAVIFRLLSHSSVRKTVFLWAVITSLFLFSFPVFGFEMKSQILFPFITVNFFFILLFYHLLFRKKSSQSVKMAFILINSFALVIFCLLIISRI